MAEPAAHYHYTTNDEIAFLRKLAATHNSTQLLQSLREKYAQRDWNGRGMHVDRDRVLAELDTLIGCARAVAGGSVLSAME